MAKKQGVNEKKQKGNEIKAANKAKKDAAAAAAAARIEDANWKKGSNVKGEARANAAAEKADEQARKRAEKAALLAAEEADMSGKPKVKLTNLKKKGGKKKNDLSLLEDALVGNADKKAKADKRAARLRKDAEELRRKEKEQKKKDEMKSLDPLMANTNAMIGNSIGNEGRLNESLDPTAIEASGIDSALANMKLSSGVVDDHPEKRMKALHKAFEEKMMPQMKEEYPGLKRSQYLEKIFALWKKSPDNPMNWPKE